MHAQLKTAGSYQPVALLSGDATSAHLKPVVVLAGQALSAGAVLGTITASKKVLLSLAAASDGSEKPDLILAHDVDASAGDTDALAYFTGPFNSQALTLGAGHSLASVFEPLRAKGIYLD